MKIKRNSFSAAFLTALLCAAFTFGSIQRAPAPAAPLLLCAFKVMGGGGLVLYAAFVWNCDRAAKCYLVCYTDAYGEPSWGASKASAPRLRAVGGQRWEGPMDQETAEQRAWENNTGDPADPMWPMSVLGTIPLLPSHTNVPPNMIRVTLNQSVNGGPFAAVAQTIVPWGDNFCFAPLPATGTAGFSQEELSIVAEADVAWTNAAASERSGAYVLSIEGQWDDGQWTVMPEELLTALRQQDRETAARSPGPWGPLTPMVPEFSEVTHLVIGFPGQPLSRVICYLDGSGSVYTGGIFTGDFPPETFEFRKVWDLFVPGLTPTCNASSTNQCSTVGFFKLPWLPIAPKRWSLNAADALWVFDTASAACTGP